jgi:hypothetical protein
MIKYTPRSASGKMMDGFLPPSSREIFLKCGAATVATVAPVAVPPVKETALTADAK